MYLEPEQGDLEVFNMDLPVYLHNMGSNNPGLWNLNIYIYLFFCTRTGDQSLLPDSED